MLQRCAFGKLTGRRNQTRLLEYNNSIRGGGDLVFHDSVRMILIFVGICFLGETCVRGSQTIAAPPHDPMHSLTELSLTTTPVQWLDASAPPASRPVAAPVAEPLDKGGWDLELGGAYITAVRGRKDRFGLGSVGAGYFICDDFSLNADIDGYGVKQPGDGGAVAVGFDLYARWYFLTLERVVLFADCGAGVFVADKEVPEHGTAYNFTPKVGAGVGYRLYDNWYLLFWSPVLASQQRRHPRQRS